MTNNKKNRILPIIDAHHHFWDLSMMKHPWLCEKPQVKFRYGDYSKICKDFLVNDYKIISKNQNIVKTIHMEAEWISSSPVEETIWLHKIYDKFNFPNAIVAQAWLHESEVESILKHHTEYPLVKSIRQKPNYDNKSKEIVKLEDESFRKGYKLLSKYDLHYDLQIPWEYLTHATKLAKDFPETTIILNHTGLPSDRSKKGILKWKKNLKEFSLQENTALKISGIGVKNQKWNLENNGEIIKTAINIFGVERCMFASNFPVDSLCATFDEIFNTFKESTNMFDYNDKKKLFHDNALKYYKPA